MLITSWRCSRRCLRDKERLPSPSTIAEPGRAKRWPINEGHLGEKPPIAGVGPSVESVWRFPAAGRSGLRMRRSNLRHWAQGLCPVFTEGRGTTTGDVGRILAGEFLYFPVGRHPWFPWSVAPLYKTKPLAGFRPGVLSQRQIWWRRRDSGSAPFDAAWTMPSSQPVTRLGCGAYYTRQFSHPRELVPHILVRAPSLPNQRAYESLQGRAGWPHSTPRRCHAVPERCFVPERRQGSPNEPRFHSALAGRGDHGVNRTRVRKYSANRFYMRSLSLI